MKTKRTRQHNPDGTIIYNTFNSTGLDNQYSNVNSRFNTKFGIKGEDNQKTNCTIVGCGKQCCTSTILLSDISGVDVWRDEFDYGRKLKPGGKIEIGNGFQKFSMGTIDDIVITNTNDCISIPQDDEDPDECTNAFPINISIIVSSGPQGCQNINVKLYNQLYINGIQITGAFVIDMIVNRVPGVGRVGAPYRAPLAGYRKTLKCCEFPKDNCNGQCYLKFKFQTILPPGPPNIGDHVYYNTKYIGEVILVNLFTLQGKGEFFVLPIIDLANNLDCESKKSPFTIGATQYSLTNVALEPYQNVMFLGYHKNQCNYKNKPVNDVYKDPSVKSCGKDNRVCYDKRIRSGMQPKEQVCITFSKVSDGNWKRHSKKLCSSDVGYQKPYSYSYSQYNKNRALNTYKRGLERNLPVKQDGTRGSACPDSPILPGYSKNCEKSSYRKSAGNSCLNCVNNIKVLEEKLADPNITSEDRMRIQLELAKAISARKRMSKHSKTVWKPNNNKFKVQGAVTSGGRLERLKLDTVKAANSKCRKGQRCDSNGNGNGRYLAGKPRFDGWMFNAAHLEKVWPSKIMSAIRYKPQPLGIAQLTNRGRSTRSNKAPASWNSKSRGTYGLYQRSDDRNIRAPGYGKKCVANCPIEQIRVVCDDKNRTSYTFKDWVTEYAGTNSARYIGNIKCQ